MYIHAYHIANAPCAHGSEDTRTRTVGSSCARGIGSPRSFQGARGAVPSDDTAMGIGDKVAMLARHHFVDVKNVARSREDAMRDSSRCLARHGPAVLGRGLGCVRTAPEACSVS